MISLHRVANIQARLLPESTWLELEFKGTYDESATITIYFTNKGPQHDPEAIYRYVQDLADAINSVDPMPSIPAESVSDEIL